MTRIGSRLAAILFSLLTVSASAASVQVQSTVDRDRVGVGDDFVYTISVISDASVDIQAPRPPDLDGFQMLESWDATAVSQRLAPGPNGMDFQSQHRREFNYRLKPTKPGRLNIGAFDLTVDGKRESTNPMVMEVSPTSQGRRKQANPQNMGIPGFPDDSGDMDSLDKAEEEMFKQLLQRRGAMLAQPRQQQQVPQGPSFPHGQPQLRTMPDNPNEAFFIQVEVDKTEVYEGEQITAAWYILTRGQMETLDRVAFPALRGFWKEVIEEAPSIQFTDEIINGVPFKKALLAAHALFPIKAGTSIIDEYKIKSRVRLPQQTYGGIAYGPSFEYTKPSKRVEIKVKPLPVDGRPSTFTGAVGTYDIHASVDSQTVTAQQPFTLKLRFEGEGNAKAIDLPAIEWPKTVELYDTKSDSQFFKNGHSFKEFTLLLIPRAEGPLEIPAITMSFFNPRTGKYDSRSTEPIHLTVTAGAPGQNVTSKTAAVGSPSPGTPATAPRADQLPDPIVAFHAAGFAPGIFQKPVVWVALYLCVFLLLAFKARMELGGGHRRRNLQEILNKRLKAFDKTVADGDPRKIGAEMVNLFSLVLGDVAGEVGASEEVDKVLGKISPSLRRDYGNEILKRHEVFQVLAFAPTEALGDLKNPERLQREINDAKTLLQNIVKRSGEDADVTAKA